MKALGIITIIFTSIYALLNGQSSLILNLSNGTFIIGLIYLLIALVTYVHNVGFFKLISYHRYRKRQMKLAKSKIIKPTVEQKMNSDYTHNDEIMELHEFCDEHYKNQWSNKIFLIYSIPLLIVSYVLAYFVK